MDQSTLETAHRTCSVDRRRSDAQDHLHHHRLRSAADGGGGDAGLRLGGQPEPGAYVFVFSGAWHEITPDGQDILHDWTPVDPNEPEGDWNPPDAIPADMDIWLYFRWLSPTRGVVQTLPLGMYVKLDTYPVIDMTPTRGSSGTWRSASRPTPTGRTSGAIPTRGTARLWTRSTAGSPRSSGRSTGGPRSAGSTPASTCLHHAEVHALDRRPVVRSRTGQYTPVVTKRGVVESLAGFMVAEP